MQVAQRRDPGEMQPTKKLQNALCINGCDGSRVIRWCGQTDGQTTEWTRP